MNQYDPTRLDASESAFFQRELESIDNRVYDELYPLLKGRMLLPKVTDVGEYDKEYTYRMFSRFGEAKVIADGATDLPKAGIEGKEFTSRIKPLGIAYGYNLHEIRAAAAKGKPLDDLLARAARRGTEQKIDSMLAFTDAECGTVGFIDNAAVDAGTYAPTAKTTSNDWAGANGGDGATGPEMVADVNLMVNQVWNALEEADGIAGRLTVVLPTAEFARLATTPMGDNADKTALRFLLDNNPFLEAVESWSKLAGAGAASANRMICYVKDPMVCGAIIPQEYTPLPAQQMGLYFQVPTTAACGGAVVRYPIAMAYGDGI